jgi:methylmalonyl-CoA carboxyltransferase small subunit
MKLRIVVEGKTYELDVRDAESNAPEWAGSGPSVVRSSVLPTAKLASKSDIDESKVCRTPLAGVVSRVPVSPGQQVTADEILLVLEAMKMEIKITAESRGTVKSVAVSPGDAVKPNQILITFE